MIRETGYRQGTFLQDVKSLTIECNKSHEPRPIVAPLGGHSTPLLGTPPALSGLLVVFMLVMAFLNMDWTSAHAGLSQSSGSAAFFGILVSLFLMVYNTDVVKGGSREKFVPCVGASFVTIVSRVWNFNSNPSDAENGKGKTTRSKHGAQMYIQ